MANARPIATILVTGGAGFIGSALVRFLLANTDVTVVNVDKLTYAGNLQSLPGLDESRHRFVRQDICDGATMKKLLMEFEPDAIAHLAAESHVDRSIDGPGEFINTNIIGTYTLLESALEYWRSKPDGAPFIFHHISTDEVFGSLPAKGRFTEESAFKPNSPYSASKASADHLVRSWHKTYRLPVVMTNCSNNYGPYQFPEKLIPLVIINALEGKALPIYGAGTNVRDWLYVEDHVRALWDVIRAGREGETYNVGGDAERRNIDVVRSICAILDELLPESANVPHASLIEHVEDRAGHDMRYAIDAGKIKRELGWSQQEGFESGLRKTVEWYLSNDTWWRAVTDGSYQGERLGLQRGN